MLDTVLLVVPFLVVGAHLVSMFMGVGESLPWRHFLLTREGWRSGYASYGAIAGTVLALAAAAWLHRRPPLLFLDLAVVPGLFLASIVGRTGCFLTHCCFGAPTSVSWGVRFEIDAGPWRVVTPPSHPTQLYEIAVSFVLLLAFLTRRPAIERRLGTRAGDGALAALGLGLFFVERFAIEFVRVGGTSESVWHGFSKTHFVTASGMLVCALWLLSPRRAAAAA